LQQATATDAAKEFHRFLGLVEHGQSVQIRKHGRAVARLIPDCDFMPGKRAAAIFRTYKAEAADRAAANATPPRSPNWIRILKMNWLIDTDILIEGERGNAESIPWLESLEGVATADIIRLEFLIGVHAVKDGGK
jgi:antitoxin (DNA-binding transcriptional repressor) of toxin-antitoxin stability system